MSQHQNRFLDLRSRRESRGSGIDAAAVRERNYQIRLDSKMNGPPNSQFTIFVHRDHFFTNSAQGMQQQEASV